MYFEKIEPFRTEGFFYARDKWTKFIEAVKGRKGLK